LLYERNAWKRSASIPGDTSIMEVTMERKKITISDLMAKKEQGRKITMLTAYDYPTAQIVDQVGIDTILVGDSLGMVVIIPQCL
jgi:AmiR/NasT family two-component response regulator